MNDVEEIPNIETNYLRQYMDECINRISSRVKDRSIAGQAESMMLLTKLRRIRAELGPMKMNC